MNMQEALNQWGDAAQEGDAEAQYILGMNCVMAHEGRVERLVA
jgi:TPR repeat protein